MTPAQFFPARADIVVPAGMVGPDSVTFDVHAFVVRRGTEIALVDSLMQPEHLDLIQAALADAQADFTDIRYVVLTHHHPDHTGGLAALVARAPQAQFLCGAGDLAAISASSGISLDAVGTGETVMGLEVIETPGHTPGHLCLFDQGSSTMLLGDAAGNINGLTRAPAAFTEDAAAYEVTLRSLAERQFERALPSHGAPVTADAAAQLLDLARRAP